MKGLKFVLGAFLIAFAFSVNAQTLVEEEEKNIFVPDFRKQGCGYTRPVRVAGMIGNPPFGWVERHDELPSKDLESYGLGRLVLDKLASRLGFKYESTGFLSYTRAVTALKKGEIDLLLSSYYRPQDLGAGTSIVFPGYFKNVFTVYFKKGKEIPVTSLADLEGLKGIVRREEQLYPLIYQRIPRGVNLKQVSTAKRAFEMLMKGEADYLIGSPYSEEAELRRYKLHEDIVHSSQVLLNSNLFFVFTTNSDCRELNEKFSQELQNDEFSTPKMELLAKDLIDDWGERFRESPSLLEEEQDKQDAPKEVNFN